MSQFKNIVKELRDISNQMILLVENEAWDVFDEIVEMIRLFGENIHSNGIRTSEHVSELQTIKKENTQLYANIVYDNLQLLIIEYESLLAVENQNQIVIPFRYQENEMALVKQQNGDHYFLNETVMEYESLQKKINDDTEAIILLGYGSGLFHANLLKDYHVLTIDPFDLSKNVKSEEVLSSEASKEHYKVLLQSKFQSFIGLKTEVIKHPLYEDTEELIDLLKLVRNYLSESRIDLTTRKVYTESWYQESFQNVSYLNRNSIRLFNIDCLKHKYKGSHALMIAGGPSLEDAIPYLKQAQHAYYIVAIGQTVKVLLENGIRPDFVISIDAGEANAHFFNDIEIDVPLVYSLQVNHQIPQRAKGLLIPYADARITQDLLSYSKTVFSTYPTVALAAVAFANYLDFDSIGLIGQDLALREGEYYSASVKQVSSNDGQFNKTLYDIPLNNGEMGKTTPILFGFLTSYQALLKSHPGLSKKLVNYAEKGAQIDEVPYQSLKTLHNTPIQKQQLGQVREAELNVSIEHVQQLLDSVSERLQTLEKRLRRVMNQKAVTVDEFEKMLRDWDAMIEAPSFRTHIMPLQLVNLLIIQNKIKFHNRYNRTSALRLSILSRMFESIQELQTQLYTIKQAYAETIK
ncbi:MULTISPECIES: 6-hydroxymethylpterin diphosphokinase MptE-like protein [unclassified Exiguobacterium]|uniref:motility associated factor glycosyltransferase family protein n=1 Tax=unclassified Exiguobacterium TaxID=2644629 RepID=UPI001BEA97BA|nr:MULTISPECIES: 6-hydroxymethylpterin diphosphokinase MptE-like protein [unclassified Exiguobacterium]